MSKISQKEEVEIIDEVQSQLNACDGVEIDLWEIIEDDPDLTRKQKEWAKDNLGVTLTVERF